MKYYVSFLLILMLFVSCSSKGNKATTKQKSEIGKYVYIDKAGVLHTKNGCKAVYKDHNMQSVEPIMINNVNRKQLKKICSQCVKEKQLDSLMNITNFDYINLRNIYQTLINEGYTPPEFQQFINDMKDENNLREVYKTLKKEGYDPPVFKEFKENVGL